MSQASSVSPSDANDSAKIWSIRFLLFIAGLGGLLYGIDVGIIAGALPYMEATSGLNANELSYVVAAVLLGSVISTMFAGMLADFMGRKKLMTLSGLLFVLSIPVIAVPHGFEWLLVGRLLQGVSAGLIGVVVPLYLAECLSAATRGKGTGIFQWLLTLGIVAAALIAIFFSMWLDGVKELGDNQKYLAAQDLAWRSIFWVSLPPGVLFVIGSLMVTESPRWLFRRGRKEEALAALLRSRSAEQAAAELKEMEDAEIAEKANSTTTGQQFKESLMHRKYLVPFLLACIILACNQATGVNSIIGYNATILIQAGLSDVQAHWGYVILTSVNFLVTMLGVMLVDRKGRKFLLSIGSAGIIVSLVCVAYMFHQTEKDRVDCKDAVQSLVTDCQDVNVSFPQTSEAFAKDKDLTITLDGGIVSGVNALEDKAVIEFKQPIAETKLVKDEKKKTAMIEVAFSGDAAKKVSFELDENAVKNASAQENKLTLDVGKKIDKVKVSDVDQRVFLKYDGEKAKELLKTADKAESLGGQPSTIILIYAFGDFRAASNVVRSDDKSAKPLDIRRSSCVPDNRVKGFFSNPFANVKAAQTAPLKIENALITPVPSTQSGWLTAFFTFCFMAFFAVGPGVCVWLALSELMPTRIRSNGMSIALLINQAVSTTIAAIFLPTVGKYGYSTMFFTFAACTVVYFVTATFFLPETKGKTLEEIESHFSGKK